jgi:hypothetical protein
MESREALTIRFPPKLLARAREVKSDGESLNELVVSAVEREVERRRGLRAYEEIRRVRAEIEARTGLQPDSTPLIRSLREGNAGRG